MKVVVTISGQFLENVAHGTSGNVQHKKWQHVCSSTCKGEPVPPPVPILLLPLEHEPEGFKATDDPLLSKTWPRPQPKQASSTASGARSICIVTAPRPANGTPLSAEQSRGCQGGIVADILSIASNKKGAASDSLMVITS